MIGTPGPGYRPGLDGLRAIAVTAVLLFHLDRLPGGNLGVDAFFVVSGWLITWKLLADREQGGRIDVGRFWAGRLRRLMPASMAVLLTVAVVWPLAGFDVESLRRELAAAAVGLSNWNTIAEGGDYWARFGDPSPLTHYWSLAIEQQFYLVWPLAIGAIAWATRRIRLVVAALSLVGAAGSIVLMNVMFDPLDPTATYVNTFARAHSLLLGAAAGAMTTVATDGEMRFGPVARRLAPAAALVAMAIVATSSESSAWLFTWGFPTFAVAMTVVVVAAADGGCERLLASGPARWLADRSYGLYLWHWPVFLFLSPDRLGVEAGSTAAVLLVDVARVAVAVALADVSLRWLEQPIRRRRRLVEWRAGVAAAASMSVLAAVLVVVVPGPTTTSAESVVTLPPAPAAVTTTVPATTAPSVTTVPVGDPATSVSPDADVEPPGSTTTIVADEPVGPVRVLVTGDSMAVHLSDAMLAHAAAHPERLVAGSASFGGCGLSAGADGRLHEFTTTDGDRDLLDLASCVELWEEVPGRVVDEAIDVVLVNTGAWDAVDIRLADGTVHSVGDAVGRRLVEDAYVRFAEGVRNAGAALVWVVPPDAHLGWGSFDDPVNEPARWSALRAIVGGLDAVEIDLPTWLVEEELTGPAGRPDGLHLGPGLNERFVTEVVMPTLDGLRSGRVGG